MGNERDERSGVSATLHAASGSQPSSAQTSMPPVAPIPPPSIDLKSVRFPAAEGARIDIELQLNPLGEAAAVQDEIEYQAIAPLLVEVDVPGRPTAITGEVSVPDVDAGIAIMREHGHHTFEVTLASAIPANFPPGIVAVRVLASLSATDTTLGRLIGEADFSFRVRFPLP